MASTNIPDGFETQLVAVAARAGTFARSNRLRKTLAAITTHAGAPWSLLLIRRVGSYVALNAYRCDADEQTTREYWRLASAGARRTAEHVALVPILLEVPDFLTGERLRAVFVLGPSSRLDSTGDVSRASGLAALGSQLALVLDSESTERYSSALQRLVASGNQLTLTKDVSYQVAKEIRALVHYDVSCITLSWSGAKRAFSPLAVLPGKQSTKRREHFGPHEPIAWTLSDDPSELAIQGRGGCYLARGDMRTRWEIVRLRETGHRVQQDGHVSGRARIVIAALSRLLEDNGLSRGHAQLFVPIVANRAVIGLQVIAATDANAFAELDVRRTLRCSEFCVPALARDRALETELEYLGTAADFEPLNDFPEPQPLRDVLSLLAERIRHHRGADRVVILPYDYRKREVQLDSITVAGGGEVGVGAPAPDPGGIIDYLLPLQSGRVEAHRFGSDSAPEWRILGDDDQFVPAPFLVPDEGFFMTAGVQSFYGTVLTYDKPLTPNITGHQPVGVLVVAYRRRKGVGALPDAGAPGFSASDRHWIEFYAHAAARYLSKQHVSAAKFGIDQQVRRLFDRVSRHQLAAEDSGGALSTEIALAALLDDVLASALDLIEGTAGVIAVPCTEHHDLKIISSRNLELDETGRHIAYGEGVTGYCGANWEPVVIVDSRDESTWPLGVTPLPWVDGSRCEVAVPLLTAAADEKRLIAVLNVDSQRAAGVFGAAEVETLQQLGRAAALALELSGQVAQLRSLSTVGEEIDRAPTERSAFESVLTHAMQITGAYGASVRLVDPTGRQLEPVIHKGEPSTYVDKAIDIRNGMVGWVYLHQSACVVDDLRHPEPEFARYPGLTLLPSRAASLSELCVPITWGDHHMGVLNLEHVQEGGLAPFREFCEALAAQVAYVLHQERQHRSDLRERDQQLVSGVAQFASAMGHDLSGRFAGIESLLRDQHDCAYVDGHWTGDVLRLAKEGQSVAAKLLEHAGHPLAPVEPVNVEQVVREVVADYVRQDLCRVEPLRIVHSGDPYTIRVKCKRAVLAWCVRNVMDNSIRHGGRPRIGISVTLRCPEVPGDCVVLTLTDNGVGMSDERIAALWARTPDEFLLERQHGLDGGHGTHRIGLPLMRSYIAAMGGTMGQSSHESGGLATTIEIPSCQAGDDFDE